MIKKFFLYLKINSAIRKAVIAASLCLIAIIFLNAIFGNFGSLLAKSPPLPVNLHSAKQANYSQDPAYMQIPPMQLQLIVDSIWDQNPDTQNLSLRLTQAEQIYFANVASITPQLPTNTLSPITGTPLPDILTQTTTPSLDVSPSLTDPGPTYTSTPLGPTATSSPSPSTVTQPPPTYTVTQQPPTNTLVSPCKSITLTNFVTETKRARWSINNNSISMITIEKINLTWPSGNDSLDKIFFGSSKIWDHTAPPPSVLITSDWTGGSRNIGNSSTRELIFTFVSPSISSGYNLFITFTNGCIVNKSN